MRDSRTEHEIALGALMGAVHSERQRRQAPAVLALSRRRNRDHDRKQRAYSQFSTPRILLSCIRAMLRASVHFPELNNASVVLARKSHKFEETKRELQGCGVDEAQVTYLPIRKRRRVLVDFAMGRGKVVRNMATLLYLWNRTRKELFPFLELVCTYAVLVRECRAQSRRFWLVVGDLSPFQIALAAAAKRTGHRLLTWQYDYLDFKKFPVKPDFAIVLNDAGFKLARMSNSDHKNGRVYWRSGLSRRPVNLDGLSEKPIGVLLNAFADASVINSVLRTLHPILNSPLIIRRHPNSMLSEGDLFKGMTFQARGASMSELVGAVGIVICGNTSAQLKALCLGAPIVQISGLDPMIFDHHGYVARGIVYGTTDLKSVSIESVREFYSDGKFEKMLSTILGPPPHLRTPTVGDLAPILSNCLIR